MKFEFRGFQVGEKSFTDFVRGSEKVDKVLPRFDEEKLYSIIERAETLNGAAVSAQQLFTERHTTKGEVERRLRWLESQVPPPNKPELALDLAKKIKRCKKDLERAERLLEAAQVQRDRASAKASQARSLAERLAGFARNECGWRMPSDPETLSSYTRNY